MNQYLSDVWKVRYFWWHLSMSDLRSRFRRSYFGMLWAVMQPLGLTVLISLVFSRLFNQPIAEYAPYILSGIIVWEYITATTVGGALAFVQADAYIKQTRHPLAIYTLRNVVTGLIVMSVASLALVAWVVLFFPGNIGWSWLAAPTIFPLIAMIAWPLATIMAYIGVRFRDLPNALALILQAAWFVSPVYFMDTMFRNGGLGFLLDYNPIYHLLQIVRAPVLQGEWPTATNYAWCLATAAALAMVAALLGKRSEKNVIFYL
ncbi:ABC transporter permease [Aliihoeflea aestuarii]|jgi:lipopolysaccharide transport system permease protein|uniref:ABC transporter permease n=1 Tax=Aliihoeflea aestuarii TaxID=453840 RepID=UPI002092290F|nr:ABC transporter permease [Aliihoeflea aestuarii]MCO6391651.1 ABC transporter permease [Aliihoeflea aestuarii]